MAGMQRSWRRDWKLKKPAWQSMAHINLERRRKKTANKVINLASRRKRLFRQIAASIAAMQLLSGFGMDYAYASNITIDNRTATQVDVNGNVTNIHTDTFRGQNAFNSFKDFNVANGEIVNLHFSNIKGMMTAVNLLNYVSGGKMSTIDGMLNGIKDGRIGGNVYFLNPKGMMVGSTGIINVGKLTSVTPSQSSIDNFLNNTLNGQAGTTAYWSNFNPDDWVRTVPLSADGSIVVQGKINAASGVSVRTTDFSNAGTISSGASFQASAVDFSDVVNANGLDSGIKIAVDGGTIEIIADKDIVNSGKIINEGAANQNGGMINLQALNDVTLGAGSLLSAKGNGENSSGGNVTVLAGNNASMLNNVLINASGSSVSGDGGAIEFSGNHEVTIQGGSFTARAMNGKAGSVLIDPENINWTGTGDDKFLSDGTSYTLEATKSISLTDVIISTRQVAASDANRGSIESALSTGNSGDIKLLAPIITLGAGTKLLANANNGKTGGTVTLEAKDTATLDYVGYKSAAASIQVGDSSGGATIKGKDVVIHASATANNDYIISDADLSSQVLNMATKTLDSVQQLTQLAGINATYSQAETSAKITVKSGSVLQADDSVTLKAETVSGAGSRPLNIPGIPLKVKSPAAVGVSYAAIDATAKVEVESGAAISAKDLTVSVHNNANLDADLTAKPKSAANSSSQTVTVAVGITDVDVDATAAVGGTLNVSGDVQITASNTGSYSTAVEGLTGDNGVASAAIAIALRDTSATASLTANVPNATKVGVFAVNNITSDITTSKTQTGLTTLDAVKAKVISDVTDSIQDKLASVIGWPIPASEAAKVVKATQKSFRLSGAVAYADSNDNAAATIGGGTSPQTVNASGSVAVGSQVKASDLEISAAAAAVSNSSTSSTSGDTSKQSYSAGVAVGNYTHNSLAEIGENVTITAGKIGVASKTIIPIRDQALFSGSVFDKWTGLPTITNAIEAVADVGDVFNGRSSAKSGSDESAGSIGLSGSASILTFNNTSQAIVDTGAKLNLTGADTGAWSSDAITIDAGSAAKSVLGVTYRDKVDPTTVAFSYDAQTDIKATNDTTLLFLGGAVIPSTSSGETGLGVVVNDITVNSTVNSIVREGAVIQGAKEVQVTADNQDKIISVVTSSGIGSSFGANGSVAVTTLNEQSYALIDDEATIKADKLTVMAATTPVVWSISGGITYGKGASVGIGVVYNDIDSDTAAQIADNDTVSTDGKTRTSQLNTITPYSLTNPTGAIISAPVIDVEANTGGNIGAVTVTPAIANSSDDTSPGFFDGIKETYKDVQDMAAMVVGLKRNTVTKNGTKPEQPASPKFGLSGAGGAAVNNTTLTNTAKVSGVYLDQSKPGYSGATSLTVQGISDSVIVAASGAAAITRANSSTQTAKVGMAGSVAVNMIDNDNNAILDTVTVVGADDVAVQALSGGEQVAVAIGMTVDASKQGANIQASVAGSVSLTMDESTTKALVANSTITGVSGSGRNVEVTAYNSTDVGTGGGSLELQPLSSDATGAGVGAAVTYASISSDVTSQISNSTISSVDKIGVHADNASKIAAGGGVASLTNSENSASLAGTVIVTRVINNTTATVDSGSNLTATTGVDVIAQAAGQNSELEKLINSPSSAQNINYNALGNLGSGATGIVSVAGIVQAGKGPNAGASINYSEISENVTAQVKDSSVTTTEAAGAIDVEAVSKSNILGMAIGVGASTNSFSGGGSVAIGVIDNSTTAYVGQSASGGSATTLTANTVNVAAEDNSTISTIAGQVNLSLAQNAAVGAAVTYNDISNSTSATVDKAIIHAASKATVAGKNTSEIDSIAAAGTLSTGGPAVSGSVTINFIENTTIGAVKNNSSIDANGAGTNSVTISSEDKAKIQSLAGSLAASGGTAGAGGAFAYNNIANKNTAIVEDSSITNAASLALTAAEDATINTLSAAVSGGQNVGLSGSVSVSQIENDTLAKFDRSTLNGGSSAAIKGSDNAQINSIAGAAAFSGGASVGASVAVNTISNLASATVTDSSLNISNDLTVEGDNTSEIQSLSVSGSGGANLAFAGSSSANTVNNRTIAGVTSAAITGTAANVKVASHNTGTIKSLAGGAAVSGAAGVGLAIAVNHIGNETDAYVNGSKSGTEYDVDDLLVSSIAGGTIKSAAVGVGGGADVGVAGSTATNYISSNTKAHIDSGAVVVANNNVGVIAQTDDVITNLAGSVGIGVAAAGVGASVTVNVISGDTEAYISGDTTKVTALAHGTGLTISDGTLSGSVDLADALALDTYGRTDLKSKRNTKMVNGVAVNATATHSVENLVANVAGGLYAGVAGTTNVGVLEGNTSAYIDSARINISGTGSSSQAVSVIAGDAAYSNGFVGTLAVGAAGVGIGLDTNVFNNSTTAYVKDSQALNAVDRIEINAESTQGASSLVVSGAGGVVGVVGTGSIGIFGSTTEAYLDNDIVHAQDVSVTAEHDSQFYIAAGGITAGAVAVSGTYAVTSDSSITKAHIDDSTVNAAGAINVESDNSSLINSWGVSGALAGGAGVAGNAVVSLVNNTSQAYVTGSHLGTSGNKAASAVVKAIDRVSVTNTAGALGAAYNGVGVGASASVVEVGNTTSAYIDNSDVHTTGATAVEAEAERNLSNTAVSVGVGGTAGISGTAAVTLVGKALSGDVKSSELDKDNSGTLTKVNNLTSGDRLGSSNVSTSTANGGTAGITDSELVAVNSAGKVSVTSKLSTGSLSYRTSAVVSGNSVIDAGGEVEITAQEKAKISILTGGVAAGTVGVGGSVGVMNINNNVQAAVLDTAKITSGENILIEANVGKLSSSDAAASVKSYQGSGGLVGLGAAVSEVDVSNNVTAETASGTTLTSGTVKKTTIQATDDSDVYAEATGLTVGAVTAGVVVAHANKSGNTKALLGDANVSKAATIVNGGLALNSERSGNVTALAQAGSGGILGSGLSTDAFASDSGDTAAQIGNYVTINGLGNDVTVTASVTPQTDAAAKGFNASVGASVGAAVAMAEVTSTVTASVGDHDDITAKNLTVTAQAKQNGTNPSAKSFAEAAGIGYQLAANGMVAQSLYDPHVSASIGASTDITATGDISVTTRVNGDAEAKSSGITGAAGAGVGLSMATAKLNPVMTTYVGAGSHLAGQNILVQSLFNYDAAGINALTNNKAEATAFSATGALGVAANGAKALADTSADVDTYVLGDTTLTATGGITIQSKTSSLSDAEANGHAYAALAAGGVQADATVGSSNETYVNAQQINAGSLTVQGISNDSAEADSLSGAGGIAAGSGSVANAAVTSSNKAYTGSDVVAAVTAMKIAATTYSQASADAKGVNAGGLAVGVSLAKANNSSTVDAHVGNSNTITGPLLDVEAKLLLPSSGNSSYAYAAASGGGLIGVNATSSEANNAATVISYIGDGSTINDATQLGSVNVTATNNTKQVAKSTANTGGIVAAGANNSLASSNSNTSAYMGDGVTVNGGSLNIIANGQDDNYAKATSGTGGLISGSAATAKTTTQGTMQSYIGNSTSTKNETVTLGKGFTLSADHTAKFEAQTDSRMAAALGGSGAYAANTADYTTLASVGEDAAVNATAIDITAANHTRKQLPSGENYDVQAGSGGIVNGSAAKSETTIANTTKVTIGDGAALTMSGLRYSPGSLNLTAKNDVIAKDSVRLDAGGAIEIAKAVSTINNTQNDALIDIGSGATLDSVGNIKLLAVLTADVETKTAVKTYGGAGAAEGQSASTVKANNKITLKSGESASNLTSMRADGDITLQAGTATNSAGQAAITAIAYTDLWNKTAFPIKTKPNADGYVYQNDIITLGNNAQLASVGDVYLLTEKGKPNVIGSGTGTDLYRQVLEEIGSFFSNLVGGGDVSLAIHGGSTYSGGNAGVEANGTVNVGIENKRYLTIKTDGTVDAANTSKDITVTSSNENLTNTMQSQITKLQEMIAALNGILAPGVEAGTKGKYDALTAQVATKVVQQGHATTLSGQYQGTITTLNAQLAAEKAKSTPDQAVITSLTSQIAGATTKKMAADDDFTSLTSEIAALNAKIAALGTVTSSNTVDETKITNLIGAYNAEISMLQTKLAAQGGAASTDVNVLNIDNEIRAQSGNIYVTGDYLTGSGKLQAPGDVLISIVNNSPSFLRTSALTVLNEAGGHLYFNNANVINTSGINSRSFGSSGSFNGTLLTSANSALPAVSVTNTYIPMGSEMAPDIYIDNNITNLTGTIGITSLRGSIVVKDGVAVVGDTISLSAGKDITIGYKEGIRDVSGDIKQQWKHVADTATARGTSYSSGTKSLAELGITDVSSDTAYLAGNNIFVSGEYLNINGVIQSGIANHAATVTQEAVELAKATGLPKVLVTTASTSDLGNIAIYYNAANGGYLEAEATSVMGGYMELYGHILNTGYGELKAMDGYGTISITNNSTSPLQINTLSTGSGVQGTIKITDTAKRTSDNGAALVTVYKKLGNATNVYTNDNASHVLNLSTPDTNYNYTAANAVYSPLANQYYSWTVVKTDTWNQQRDCTEKHYFGISGGTDRDYDDPIDLATTTKVVDDDVVRVISGSTDKFILNRSHNASETAGWSQVAGSYDKDEYVLYRKETWTDQRSLKAVTVNEYNVYAANPVKISWLGSNTGAVNVNSVGSVNLNGGITNKTGATNITSSNGAITRTATADGITVQNLKLQAETGIGTVATPVNVTMLTGGKLTANSTSGDISIKGLQGDVAFDKISTSGNVYLGAENNLYGVDDASLIEGNLIQLTATHGMLGSAENSVKIRAGSSAGGGLDATAGDSIYITQTDGDLYLTQALSNAGDVVITAVNGSILDNNATQTQNDRTKAQLLALWDDMQLTGQAAQDSAANTLAAYEAQKTQEYKTYWQYRQRFTDASGNVLPYSGDQKIAFSADEKAYYKNNLGWTDAQISQRETQMTTQYQTLNSGYGAISTSYNNNWQYAVVKPTDSSGKTLYEGYDALQFAEWNSLVAGSSWTEAQLTNSLSVGLMKETSDTRITVEAPNVSGRNVVLTANNGSIGSDGSEVAININGRTWSDLNSDEKLAIMSAETKDVSVVSDKEIKIISREDVNVESGGMVTATAAAGNVYLGSEGTININQVTAGGDVRIKSRHGIVNAAPTGTVNIIGKDTILEAAQNSIGKITDSSAVINPLLIGLGSGVLTARSGGDIYLTSPIGSLNLDTVYAVYHADLTTGGNIINSTSPDQNIRAESVTLTANNGSIGSSGNYLKVGLDATGELIADANGDIYIGSPKRDLTVSKIISHTGSVGLNGGSSIALDQDGITAALDVTISTGDSISIKGSNPAAQRITANNIALLATQGSIGSAGKSLGIQAANAGVVTATAGKGIYLSQLSGNLNTSDVTAGLGDVNLTVAAGDANLGVVKANGGNVTVTASGAIANAAASASATNVTAQGITLTAQNGGIGTAAHRLYIDSSNASAGTVTAAAEGGIYLTETSGDLNVNSITAATGDINIAVDRSILNRNGNNGVNLQGKNIVLTTGIDGSIGEKGNRLVTSLTGQFIPALTAFGDIAMEVRSGDLITDTLTSSNGAIDLLVANGKAEARTVSAAGDINGNFSGNFTTDTMLSQNGSITLVSGGSVTGNSVTAADIIDIAAQGGTFINRMTGGTLNFALTAPGGILSIGDISVSKSLTATADNVILSHVVHTGAAPLQMAISGGSKVMADSVAVNVTSVPGVQFNNFSANQAVINGQTDKIALYNTLTGTRAEIISNYYKVVADNNPPLTLFGSDVLLRPLATRYDLLMDGKAISTNTTVVNSQSGIRINGSATSDTAVDVTDKVLKVGNQTGVPEFRVAGSPPMSSGGGMPNNTNLANTVDITQLMNFQNEGNMPGNEEESNQEQG